MSYRYFQSVIIQMKSATDRTIGVIDNKGLIVASGKLSSIGTQISLADKLAESDEDNVFSFQDKTFKKITRRDANSEYTVYVEGTDELARSICILAAVAVSEAMMHYEEKYDKSTLVKNIINDNVLPSDLYSHAKELDFSEASSHGVFLVRSPEHTDGFFEHIQAMFQDKQHDFVLSMSETDVAVIKEIPVYTEEKDLYKTAVAIERELSGMSPVKTVIGIGTPAKHIRELADKYKETLLAIEIGRVFDPEKTIISYESLGLGRLVYQLPTTLCEMFLDEIFKKNPIDSLDKETLAIIDKFFENNLNISETSRKLFVHRNTLVYRLGKIKKLTGLDLREFDQAIVFKVALMVKKYLDSKKA